MSQSQTDGQNCLPFGFFCFNLSIGVKNSRIKMNRMLISHDFWWIEFYFSSSSFHFMSDLYNKCQFQLSNHRRLYRIISFLIYPHFSTVGWDREGWVGPQCVWTETKVSTNTSNNRVKRNVGRMWNGMSQLFSKSFIGQGYVNEIPYFIYDFRI